MKRNYRKKKSTLIKRVRKLEKNTKPEIKKSCVIVTTGAIYDGANSGLSRVPTDNIAGGSASFERVGNVIKWHALHLDFFLDNELSANAKVRVLVVRPRVIAQTLANDLFTYTGCIDPDRFIVLYDRFITMVLDTNTEVVRLQKRFKLSHQIRYDTNLASSCTQGEVEVYLVSNRATNTPKLNGTVTMYYTDV